MRTKLSSYCGYEVELSRNSYENNGRLAVSLICLPEHEPFGTISVNINYPLSRDEKSLTFVDTNNYPGIEKWLRENQIAKPTGYYGRSGYCTYPEYRFDLEKLEEKKRNDYGKKRK